MSFDNTHPLIQAMRQFVAARAPQNIDSTSAHFDVFAEFNRCAAQMRAEYVAAFGPRIELQSRDGQHPALGSLAIVIADRDNGDVFDSVRILGSDEWWGSPQDMAGRAYRRECGWDASPGDSGIWLLACRLTHTTLTEPERWHSANLVGFAVVQDFDEDGEYESLAHVWTAGAARGKGIGSKLVAEARRRFPLKEVEHPLTEMGCALLTKCWPEVLME